MHQQAVRHEAECLSSIMHSTSCQKYVVYVQRVMNARQFGLKLIANVTYGYTSAGFSGRMPMAEIADSIVQVRAQQHTALVYQPNCALQHAASSQHACPHGCLTTASIAEASLHLGYGCHGLALLTTSVVCR